MGEQFHEKGNMETLINVIIFLMFFIGALVMTVEVRDARIKDKSCRLQALQSDYVLACETLLEWEKQNPFHTPYNETYQKLLASKIFRLKQLAFSKGHLTMMEKRYILCLQEMQLSSKEWSDW